MEEIQGASRVDSVLYCGNDILSDSMRELWYCLRGVILQAAILRLALMAWKFCRYLKNTWVFIVLIYYRPNLLRISRLANKGARPTRASALCAPSSLPNHLASVMNESKPHETLAQLPQHALPPSSENARYTTSAPAGNTLPTIPTELFFKASKLAFGP